MNIIQQPDSLSLSQNIKRFLIGSAESVSFVLRQGGEVLVSQKYEPGDSGTVEIDVRDIVHARLSYKLRNIGQVYIQPDLVSDFTAVIDGTEVPFRVLRGGVDRMEDSAAEFLKQNFLTWQPQLKHVTYYTPEFLTYYAVVSGTVQLRAYFTNSAGAVESTTNYALASLVAGNAYTLPLQYALVVGWLGGQMPSFYDVWVENSSGQRLSYVQRYAAEAAKSLHEEWVLWENSLGGLDTFRAYGVSADDAQHTHNIAEIDEESEEYRVDTERLHKKDTGYLTKNEATWLLDFFPSLKKYIYLGNYLRQIVVTESGVTRDNKLEPTAYSFTYKYADARPLLNLPRTEVRADMLNITLPDVGSFTLPPRLAEVARQPLSEGVLFPVQDPYSEEWGTASGYSIASFLAHFFAETFGKGGGVGHAHENYDLLAAFSYVAGYLLVSGQRIKAGYADIAGDIRSDKYLRKDIEDTAQKLIHFLEGIDVKGHSVFHDSLSSEDFISGFTSGKGWGLFLKKMLNAAGVEEELAELELDVLTVRRTLKVYEFIISQMRGENDNVTFSSFLKVDHHDAETDRIYLQTEDGQLYNPFRFDDILCCQQFNGMPSEENDYTIVKYYELLVTEAQVGSLEEGDKRLDWITFKNFVGDDIGLIKKGDVLVRIDNKSNPDRKGIIQMITVGNATPYMDIVYGLKTDPDNALKGRLGNLKGIHHHLFGWLDGFGEYLINLYAVGDFRLRRTGESVDARFEVIRDTFTTHYQKLTYELTEENNYLTNATFTESMDGWTFDNECDIISMNGEALLMNGNVFAVNGKLAKIEPYEERNMLHLRDSFVRQANSLIRQPGTHREYISNSVATGGDTVSGELTGEYKEVADTLYLSIKFLAKTDGILTIGMDGSTGSGESLPAPTSVEVTGSTEWQTLQWSGTWDGAGDFLLQYTGEMYVAILSLTDKALDDFKKEVSTNIEQTAEYIRLLGTNIDRTNGKVTQLGIELNAANEEIRIYANKTTTLETEVGNLKTSVTNLGIELDAAGEEISIYANKTTTLETEVGGVKTSVTTLETKYDALDGRITQTVVTLNNSIAGSKGEAIAAAQDYSDKLNTESSALIQAAQQSADNAQHSADDAQASADEANARIDYVTGTTLVQTNNAIAAVAAKFDPETGELLNKSGLLVMADKTQLVSQINDVSSTIETECVRHDGNGNITTNIRLRADQITLEGVTTINNSFQVLTNGTTIFGGFKATEYSITSTNEEGESMSLSADYIRFSGSYASVLIGPESAPVETGGAIAVPVRISINRNTSASLDGNCCMQLSAQGATAYDNMDSQLSGNHALFIPKGDICGVRFRTRRISSSQTLSPMDTNIICTKYNITVTLPSGCEDGQEYRICAANDGSDDEKVTVTASGASIVPSSCTSFSSRRWHIYIFDKVNSVWRAYYTNI